MNKNNNQNNEWSKRKLGALWKKDSAKGKYLSGYLNLSELGINEKINVVLFSNKNKNKDTAPDFRIYISKDKPQAVSNESALKQTKTFVKQKPVVQAKKVQEEEVEEDLL